MKFFYRLYSAYLFRKARKQLKQQELAFQMDMAEILFRFQRIKQADTERKLRINMLFGRAKVAASKGEVSIRKTNKLQKLKNAIV